MSSDEGKREDAVADIPEEAPTADPSKVEMKLYLYPLMPLLSLKPFNELDR